MQNDLKRHKKNTKQQILKKNVEKKLKRWKKMLRGDRKALIEITIECGMAKKEDFPDYFHSINTRA